MNIYCIREFWFDDFYDGSGNVQRAFITWADFNQQNIKVTAQLNVLAPGAHIVGRRAPKPTLLPGASLPP